MILVNTPLSCDKMLPELYFWINANVRPVSDSHNNLKHGKQLTEVVSDIKLASSDPFNIEALLDNWAIQMDGKSKEVDVRNDKYFIDVRQKSLDYFNAEISGNKAYAPTDRAIYAACAKGFFDNAFSKEVANYLNRETKNATSKDVVLEKLNLIIDDYVFGSRDSNKTRELLKAAPGLDVEGLGSYISSKSK